MGSAKRNLLTSILLLVVMGVFAVLTIFIVVDAINKKYYNDIKVEYEVQEESPNIILTFARNEGSNFSTDNTKVVLNEDKTKFRIDGTVPTIENGVVTNLDDLTSSDGREFYFFSTNSSFIDPQEDPENPDFIFSETDYRYYVSTEDNPIWYDVPKSSENLTLYSVFLTPNVHNSDFANAPLLDVSSNVIISHDVTEIPYNAFSNALMESDLSMVAKIENVVIPNSTKNINSEVNYESRIMSGAFAACTTLTNIVIPSSVEYVGGEAFMSCTGLDTVEYGNGYYLSTESNEHAILIDTNLKVDNVTIHKDCITIQGGTFSKNLFIEFGLITPGAGESEEDYINMNLQKISIPKNVKNIGFAAFMTCMGLENVEFKANSDLTSIGMYSFAGCSSLRTINLEDTTLEEIGVLVFASVGSIPAPAIEEITLPSTLKTIGMGAFMMCMGLENVVFEDNSDLTSIGEMSFGACSSLKTINLEDTKLEEIGMMAFASMDESMPMLIEEITLPSTLKTIGEGAFFGCSSLSKINIQIESIESYLEKLQEFNPDDPTTYPINMQIIIGLASSSKIPSISLNQNGQEVTNIEIPDTMTEIPMYAFAYLTNIKSVNIPSSVTSIGERAFSGCSSLESFTFEEGSKLESLGEGVIDGCASLSNIIIEVESLEAYIEDSLINVFITVISAADLEIIPGISLYENGEHVTEIEVPGTITTIPDYLFAYLDIESIVIPSSITCIGTYAFFNCANLDSVTFENNSQLTSIGSYAFDGCFSLRSVSFGENSSLQTIGNHAFRYCSSLASITIPDSVTSIGDYAFIGCCNLAEVYDLTGSEGLNITAGSTGNGYVGYYAVEIKKEEDSTGIYYTGDNDEYVMYRDLNGNHYLVAYQGQGGDITLPTFDDGRTYSIKIYAFYEKDKLTSVKIPDSVTSIGRYAFYNCSNIQKLYIDDLTSYLNISFEDNDSSPSNNANQAVSLYVGGDLITNLVIPDGVTAIPDYAFMNLNITSVTIPDSVTSIGNYAFRDCGSLETVNFGDNSQLESIGNDAFSSCSSLETVNFGENSQLASIGNYAFYDCNSLERVEFGENSQLASIGHYAFNECSSLTSITIPESVTSIGSNAFFSCDQIQELRIDNLTSYLNISYSNYSSPLYSTDQAVSLYVGGDLITNLVIPDGVTAIPDYAFRRVNITSVTIPSSVTSIGNYAFRDCGSLESVNFGDNSQLASIGSYAFSSCSNLETINFGENSQLANIGTYAFRDCGSLEIVNFGDNSQLTSIGESTFEDCSSLTSIIIPESVTSIGSYAFRYCYKLVEVYDLTGSEGLKITKGSTGDGYVGYYAVEIKKEEGLTGIYYTGDNNEFVMYKDLEENHYLVDYKGQGGDITLPTFDDGRTYSIKSYAFYENYNVTGVKIPSSVTSIGDYAFYYCRMLVEVYDLTGPDGLNITAGSSRNGYVGYYADYVYTDANTPLVQKEVNNDYIFYYDNGVMYLLSYTGIYKELTLPSIDEVKKVFGDFGVTYEIREYAFYENTNITSVVIPEGVTSIGSYAFYNCSSLETVTFEGESQLTSIGKEAFRNCSGLASISIPSSVVSIGEYAFRDCSNISKLHLGSLESYLKINYTNNYSSILYSANKEVTLYINGIETTEIVIPEGIKSINDYAFYNFKMLTSVTFPEGLESIGSYAFAYCTGLLSVSFPKTVKLIKDRAFFSCENLMKIQFDHNSNLVLEDLAFGYCEKVEYVVIPQGTTYIGEYLFHTLGTPNIKIYCETRSSSGWDPNWNYNTDYHASQWLQADTYYAGEWEYDSETGKPRPIE